MKWGPTEECEVTPEPVSPVFAFALGLGLGGVLMVIVAMFILATVA